MNRYKNLNKLSLPPCDSDPQEELLKILDALVDNYGAESITAFGSCVRGNPTAHSDLDLFVTRNHPPDTTHPRWEGRMAVASRHPRLSYDLLVLRPDQWAEQKKSPFGVYSDVVEHGIPLYER
jgi:predicted nucleotidyltransferase